MCRPLAAAGYDYLGIDYPSSSLDFCQRGGLEVRAALLQEIAAEERRFAAVVMITVFEHLHDHVGTLAMLRRVLQPGGVVLILVPTSGLFGAAAALIRRLKGTDEIRAMNLTFYSIGHTAIFSAAGRCHVLALPDLRKCKLRLSREAFAPVALARRLRKRGPD